MYSLADPGCATKRHIYKSFFVVYLVSMVYILQEICTCLSIWEKETSLEGPSLCTNTLENRVEAVTRSPMQSQLELLVILLLTAVCAPPHTATPITSGVSALSVPEAQGRSFILCSAGIKQKEKHAEIFLKLCGINRSNSRNPHHIH